MIKIEGRTDGPVTIMQEFKHISIMPEEVIRSLNIDPEGIYVDGTLGGGGHALLVAEKLTGQGRLIGIDQDGDAIEAASGRLKDYSDRVEIVRDNYSSMRRILEERSIKKVNGILLDLGVSSWQLDQGGRGFSYREDAPLDMRMDQRQEMTAGDIVNSYSEKDLFRVIKNYGEDPFAKNIAKHIVMARKEKAIESTGQLVDIIKAAIPARVRKGGGHPAKRTFQALRIELNQELEVLRLSLEDMIDLLEDGGRLCIITFHSLEDRLVKKTFRSCENPCICPPDFPICTCGRVSKGKVITRKPILPSREELENNSRAKSAKLRVFERRNQHESLSKYE